MEPSSAILPSSTTATDRQTGARGLSLSVLTPVYNERHLVAASLARVLAVQSELLSDLELIVVDDCSTDGTWDVLQRLAADEPRIRLYRHERNQGKGASIRTALSHATNEICLVHDADLEYNPGDIPALLRPFAEEGADAVYGSRYMAAPYRRALMHRHTLMNKGLTGLSNWLTDLALTDIETCYKAINTKLLKSIPIRSNDFRFEVEITFKLAKRRARIYEAPIRYSPRSYDEGKKIRAKDGVLALAAMAKYWLIDDIYAEDEYGSNILADLQDARRFNKWMGDTLRPHIGDRVLEIGAGIGTLTGQFIPRDLYLATDINPHYLHYLSSYATGKPYLHVTRVDAGRPEDFAPLAGLFDTVLIVNVLEHVPDPFVALKNIYSALEPGGRVVVLVPQHPALFNTLDKVLEHRERYTVSTLRSQLESTGFRVDNIFDFNRTSVPAWFTSGRVFRRTKFSRVQLKVLELMMPAVRRLDRLWPWGGLSVIGVGVKPS